MSTTAAMDGIIERLSTIAGLHVVRGVPSQITDATPPPLIYVRLDTLTPIQPGAVARAATFVGTQATFSAVLLLAWQDDTPATEDALLVYADAIRDAFSAQDRDSNQFPLATLGGRVQLTTVGTAVAGFEMIDDSPYRNLAIPLTTTSKGAIQ